MPIGPEAECAQWRPEGERGGGGLCEGEEGVMQSWELMRRNWKESKMLERDLGREVGAPCPGEDPELGQGLCHVPTAGKAAHSGAGTPECRVGLG